MWQSERVLGNWTFDQASCCSSKLLLNSVRILCIISIYISTSREQYRGRTTRRRDLTPWSFLIFFFLFFLSSSGYRVFNLLCSVRKIISAWFGAHFPGLSLRADVELFVFRFLLRSSFKGVCVLVCKWSRPCVDWLLCEMELLYQREETELCYGCLKKFRTVLG